MTPHLTHIPALETERLSFRAPVAEDNAPSHAVARRLGGMPTATQFRFTAKVFA